MIDTMKYSECVNNRIALCLRCYKTNANRVKQRIFRQYFKKTSVFLLMHLLFIICLSLLNPALANNIKVLNAMVVEDEGNRYVQFDLSWENSWRFRNHDAAWVFIKYRVPPTQTDDPYWLPSSEAGDYMWRHVWLSHSGHNTGSGTPSTIDIGTTEINNTPRGMGAFIYHSQLGSGTFSITDARLQWDLDAMINEQDLNPWHPVEIKVFAIEMVYVAEGTFFLGSGGDEPGSFTNGSWDSGNAIPIQISSEATLQIGTGDGNLWGTSISGNSAIGAPGMLSESFPKGFNAFYIMKYPISQQQYVDFLNTLSRTQQNSRTATNLAAGVTSVTNRYVMTNSSTVQLRNGIRVDESIDSSEPIVFYCDLNGNGTGGEPDDGQWIAMNYISWMDGAAYMDWSGLRPMTELEYEKATRGIATPVPNEYAWGSTSIEQVLDINNAGRMNEVPTPAGTNAHYDNFNENNNTNGPVRVGSFATADGNREQSGASHWGVMEMSGNLWERTVTVGNTAGRSFTGLHGDGRPDTMGDANVDFWPGINGNSNTAQANAEWQGTLGVTNASGSGFRGGAWDTGEPLLRLSLRINATLTETSRSGNFGFRGVRTAPSYGNGD